MASAHPKIQRMCEEESDDHEAVAKLLGINDSIHRTIERYKLIKKGDLDGASKIPKGTLGISGVGVKKGPDNELSLIDFGGPDEPALSPEPAAAGASSSTAGMPAPKGNALEDDLLGLSMGDSSFGAGGGISLGPTNGFAGMVTPASTIQQSQAPPAQSSTSSLLSQSTQAPQAARPNYDPFASISSSQNPSKPASPAPNSFAFQAPQQPQQNRGDPFAALSGQQRTASPFQFQQSVKPAASPAPPMPLPQSAASLLGGAPHSNGALAAAADDEWTFSSALPDQQSHQLTITNSAIKTIFQIARPAGADDWISIDSRISNNTPSPISDLTFQLAVTKVSGKRHPRRFHIEKEITKQANAF